MNGRTSPVVQWLRLCAPSEGAWVLFLGGTLDPTCAVKILCAPANTGRSQNKNKTASPSTGKYMQTLFLFSDSPSLTPFKSIFAEPWMSLPVLSQGLSRDLQQLDKVGRKEEPLPGGRSEGRGDKVATTAQWAPGQRQWTADPEDYC